MQLLLHSWLRDMGKKLMRLDSTTAVFVLVNKDAESGRVPCIIDNMDSELDRVILIDLLGYALLKHLTPDFL